MPESSSARAQGQFHCARQKSSEDIENWHTRLLGLFVRAYPQRNAIDDPDLIRVFAMGIRDEKVMYETRTAKVRSYREALRVAQRIVSTLEEIKNVRKAQGGNEVAVLEQVGALSERDVTCYECH